MDDELTKKFIDTSKYIQSSIPKIPDFPKLLVQQPNLNPAAWAYERLGKYFKDFEADLDEEHEIGARLVSFGQTVTFHILNIGYYGPDIITFYGINENNERIQLIQNISQLSVLLIAMKKLGDKPRRIGFLQEEKEAEQ
jgi:hypothetical protein